MTDVIERWILTRKEFCDPNIMSLTTFQKLVAQGIGPSITRIGTKVMMTLQDEAEWRKSMRHPHGRAAEVAKANAEMLHQKAKNANARREDRQ